MSPQPPLKFVVVICTYNEFKNIGSLIREIRACVSAASDRFEILVVDDNSPDGTAQAVREQMLEYKDVHLLTGIRQGLGAAYTKGMIHAIMHLQADAVFQMDADFSHAPGDLLRLRSALVDGVDMVIGSRYIDGGLVNEKWPWRRRVISRAANVFGRKVAGLSSVQDCTGGFRLIRTLALKQVDLASIDIRGYAFQIGLLHALLASGLKVHEIPILFNDRQYGRSKMRLRDVVEFFLVAMKIRLNHRVAAAKREG